MRIGPMRIGSAPDVLDRVGDRPVRGGRAGGAAAGARTAGRGRPPARQSAVRGRPGRARSRPRALGQPLHRLPWLAGTRIRHRPEHHPHEDRQLRPLRRAGGQRARAVPEGRPSDAEQEAERVVHRRGSRRRSRTSCGSASTTRCAARPSSPSATSSLAIPKAGEAYFNGDGGCATCHNATDAQPRGHRHADSRRRSICSSGCCSPAGRRGGRGRGGRRRRAAAPASIATPSP